MYKQHLVIWLIPVTHIKFGRRGVQSLRVKSALFVFIFYYYEILSFDFGLNILTLRQSLEEPRNACKGARAKGHRSIFSSQKYGRKHGAHHKQRFWKGKFHTIAAALIVSLIHITNFVLCVLCLCPLEIASRSHAYCLPRMPKSQLLHQAFH